jgi:hypothetical protein
MTRYLLIIVSLFQTVALGAPTAAELLQKCTETLDKTHTSFITQSKFHRYSNYKTDIQGMNGVADTYFIQEFRTDGQRIKTITQKWGENFDTPFRPESEKSYTSSVYIGDTHYQHDRPYNSPGVVMVSTNVKEEQKNIGVHLAFENQISQCFGHLIGDVERFDRIIKKDGIGQMSVREEKFKGTTYYIIEAKTTHGQYQIWLNPEKGYNFSKATVTRKPGDAFMYGYKVGAGESKNYVIENEEFKQVDGLWVPVKAKAQINDTFPNNGYMKSNWELELTSILINPGHNALNSFSTDDIKNGAMVMIDGKQPISTWKDGKVVDSFGYEVNLSTSKPTSLVGKTLPSIAEFGVALDPNIFKSKKLLVCFFDYQQQSNQNSIQALNKQAQSLLDKDIYLIFVQVESVTEQALAAWLTQNKIQPLVGASKIDLPALGRRWGVKSLPWLILTDKNHKVTAEGFVIGDLDKKISETGK